MSLFDHPPHSATTDVHLYGGPLDGGNATIPATTQAFAHEPSRHLYSYCPYASRLFERPTFISQHIAHDALAQ